MTGPSEFLLMAILLLDLAVLGSSRIAGMVRLVAVQGLVLAALLVMANWEHVTPRLAALAAVNALSKGVAIPWLLRRSIRETGLEHDDLPYVGFMLSLALGGAAIGAGFWLAGLLPPAAVEGSRLIAPVSLATVLVGLLLLVSRRLAISQVLGYLVLENGVFVFGLAVAVELPIVVELGVLLDVITAVFVMGIILFQINREFEHIDSSRLQRLHDLGARVPSLRDRAVRPDGPPAMEV